MLRCMERRMNENKSIKTYVWIVSPLFTYLVNSTPAHIITFSCRMNNAHVAIYKTICIYVYITTGLVHTQLL